MKKTQKLWVWKAYERDSGRLVDWQCGHRDGATLAKLLERLKCWQVRHFYTNRWESYREFLPTPKLTQSKQQTTAIERTNSRQRPLGLEVFVVAPVLFRALFK